MKKTFLGIFVAAILVISMVYGISWDTIKSGDDNFKILTINTTTDSLALRCKCTPISMKEMNTPKLRRIQQEMRSYLKDSLDVVGLAAPQLGIKKQLIVVRRTDKIDEPIAFYCNPKIEHYSASLQTNREGCCSVPDIYHEVSRSEEVVVSYLNPTTGKMERETVKGYVAAIFQHEIDHLNGILFIDYTK